MRESSPGLISVFFERRQVYPRDISIWLYSLISETYEYIAGQERDYCYTKGLQNFCNDWDTYNKNY